MNNFHVLQPSNEPEKERIQNAGGSVMIQRVNGSLAVSRYYLCFNYHCFFIVIDIVVIVIILVVVFLIVMVQRMNVWHIVLNYHVVVYE